MAYGKNEENSFEKRSSKEKKTEGRIKNKKEEESKREKESKKQNTYHLLSAIFPRIYRLSLFE